MNRLAKTTLFISLLMMPAAAPFSATAQLQIFSTGQYGTPETISLAPAGFGASEGLTLFP